MCNSDKSSEIITSSHPKRYRQDQIHIERHKYQHKARTDKLLKKIRKTFANSKMGILLHWLDSNFIPKKSKKFEFEIFELKG